MCVAGSRGNRVCLQKGIIRDPFCDEIVLYLDCIHANTCSVVSKMLSPGKLGEGTRSSCDISYNWMRTYNDLKMLKIFKWKNVEIFNQDLKITADSIQLSALFIGPTAAAV